MTSTTDPWDPDDRPRPQDDRPQPQDDRALPQWERMREPGEQPHGESAVSRSHPAGSDSEISTAVSHDPRSVTARRRAVRGLSFALIMLGTLLGFGVAALGHPTLAAGGILPVLIGLCGFIAVQIGAPRSLRLPQDPARRPGRGWWWLPAILLLASVTAVGGALFTDAAGPESGSPWTMFWLVLAATLLTAGVLGLGLVATSRLSIVDDDDAALRKVDWAQEYPSRYQDRQRDRPRPPSGLYDSGWVTGTPPSSHSRRKDRRGDRGKP